MLFDKKPRWLKSGEYLINLDQVEYFAGTQKDDGTSISCIGGRYIFLHGVTLDDIHYFLKHGRPRKRKALKS